MPMSGYYAKRRLRMMEEDPHCHWCGRELKLYLDYPNRKVFEENPVEYQRLKAKYPRMPDDYPTIDHLKTSFFGKRPDVYGREKTLVLACLPCNNGREREIHLVNKWRMRWKAGSFPRYLWWLNRLLRYFRGQKSRKFVGKGGDRILR